MTIGGVILSENWWNNWFGRSWPFFRGFSDVDELFRETEKRMEQEFKELSKSAPTELVRERVLPDGSRVKSWGPFVYGYSVTLGPEGEPQVREFGNVTSKSMLGKPKIDVKEKREPLVDILESEDNINVIAELPGVAKEDINLTGTQKGITISVDTPNRKYFRELQLPCEVDLETAKSEYKNGVLEVVLKKKKQEKPAGRKLKVD
jgi:HSP20 family protein